jgi:hypothetical protein
VEHYGCLKEAVKKGDLYQNIFELFIKADEKYNSGLFDFKKDKISVSNMKYTICQVYSSRNKKTG